MKTQIVNLFLVIVLLFNPSISIKTFLKDNKTSNSTSTNTKNSTSQSHSSTKYADFSKRIKIVGFTNEGTNPIIEVEGNCNNSTCVHGKCTNSKTCKCDSGYAQLLYSKDYELCDYELKSQLTAFFLELFLILGFGQLYIQNYVYFAIKFLIIVGLLLLDFLLKYLIKFKENTGRKTVYIFSYIFYSIIVSWQVIDIVLLGLNKYNDGNGMPLYVYQG